MPPPALNDHGDRLVPTTGRHGADIASQRIDELDRRALRAVLDHAAPAPVCVDYGSGLGWQGVRLALLGARVLLVDQLPCPPLVQQLRGVDGVDLDWRTLDLRALRADDLPATIDLAFSQRTLHYLRHAEARHVVATTAARMASGARFFASVSGLDSELGDGYAAADAPVAERWAPLATVARERHGIAEPVCLYTEGEFTALMADGGFDADAVWRSPFGNVKGVFVRRASPAVADPPPRR